jgi:hypothetical protein
MERWQTDRPVRLRLSLALSAVLAGGAACDSRPAAPAARPPPGSSEAGDLTVFLGTITDIDPSNTRHPFLKWAVIVRVDEVVSGPRPGDKFWFAIHSPSQEGLEVGQRVRIRARKTAEGFAFRSYSRVGS